MKWKQKAYIVKATEPTELVTSMEVSIQATKSASVSTPSDLNKVIKREHYPQAMRTIEEVVTTIPDAKVFSKLDAKSGFLQIKLDEIKPLHCSQRSIRHSAGTGG